MNEIIVEDYKGSEYKHVTFPGGETLSIKDGGGNCKLTRWDGIMSLLSTHFDEKKGIENVKECLKLSKILVHINTHREDIKDFFEKNFEIYESIRIPCGYANYGGYQYHIFLRNSIGIPNENMRKSEYKPHYE